MSNLIQPAIGLFSLLTVLTGIIYPLAVTGIAQWVFPEQATGSLILANGQALGSALIGQPFSDPKYFWGRPSATGPFPYNAAASSGSNLGPLNPALLEAIKARVETIRQSDPSEAQPVPVDLSRSADIDVLFITGETAESEAFARHRPYFLRTREFLGLAAEQEPKAWYRRLDLLWATFTVVVCTGVCVLMFPYFALSNLIMVYLLGVGLVAHRHGREPSIWPRCERDQLRLLLRAAALLVCRQRHRVSRHLCGHAECRPHHQ